MNKKKTKIHPKQYFLLCVVYYLYMCPLSYFKKVQINQLKRQIIFETEKEDDDPSFIQKLYKSRSFQIIIAHIIIVGTIYCIRVQ